MSYGSEAFAAEFAVSRETLDKLERYGALLAEWQQRMNLVGASTLPDVWQRHFRDSAQLASLAPPLGHKPVWLDIGAGGGFPGLVLATLGAGEIHLVESIAKKCRFLQAVVDELQLAEAVVHHARIEAVTRFRADVITARACANLAQLFDWGLRFAASSTVWLLPKGAAVDDELAAARKGWIFDAELVPSRTDERGRIVVARGVKRR
ncbi:MAG: 16S rRNA (guanine(527)-N(7))-methyltransferase RsmG [Sphingomonadaceae bacterium]|nr:16S rRNA (guanine(527)-N(7))-methyltransferase RsmG [Sphingomonadaceae bacterium]